MEIPAMNGSLSAKAGFVCLVLAFSALACATEATLAPPPDRPQPMSTFDVEFTPSGSEKYAPTGVTEVKRYKTVAHWPGKPDWVSDVEEPSRPYLPVGRLHFPMAWHWLEKGVSSCPAQEGLVAHHVSAVGGDAILLCEVDERARGVLKNAANGKFMTVSRRALTLDVIRYTDR
jgi:hypothetical protein